MLRAVAYCRYSSDNQREESIDAQVRAIKEFCSRNDYDLVKVYKDEAKTGTNDNRSGFMDMIEDSEKSTFDICIVHKLDRFARSKYHSAIYKKKLQENGVRVVSVLENLDDSPESIILESVLEGMAEYYSKNLAREVMKGMKETALQCKHNGGSPPLGYDVAKDKTYVLNEKESISVKKIFEMYLKGYGYGIIAQELNNSGQCTKTARLFTKNSIRDILLNEKYTGTYIFNKRLSKKDNHKYKDPDKIIKVENAMPEIITQSMFQEVQDKINNRKVGPRMSQKRFYLLTGKLECGECGAAYVGNGYVPGRNGKKYPVYTCMNKKVHICTNKNIRQDILESYIINQLDQNIFSEESVSQISLKLLSRVSELNSEYENTLKILSEDEKDIKAKKAMCFEMYFKKLISDEDCKEKMQELENLNADIKKRKDKLDTSDFSWVDENKIKKYLLASKENLESEDLGAKRKIIETFINKILIYPDRIDVTIMIEPSNSNKKADSDKVGGGEGCRTPVRKP